MDMQFLNNGPFLAPISEMGMATDTIIEHRLYFVYINIVKYQKDPGKHKKTCRNQLMTDDRIQMTTDPYQYTDAKFAAV